jgi:hypothetical protein
MENNRQNITWMLLKGKPIQVVFFHAFLEQIVANLMDHHHHFWNVWRMHALKLLLVNLSPLCYSFFEIAT